MKITECIGRFLFGDFYSLCKESTEKMINLFISTFGENTNWIKDGRPIEVGAALRDIDSRDDVLRDDTQINISKDNAYWGELTGLYWLWNNMSFSDDDIIGFCHYNKKLDISSKKVSAIIADNNTCWIALKPVTMIKHSYPQDIEVLENVLRDEYPLYYQSWKKIYNSDGASKDNAENCMNCELFYCSSKEFNQYCTFLFSVLGKVRDVIGDVDRAPYHKRYCAFLGERLLSVYVDANQRTTVCVPIRLKRNAMINWMAQHMAFIKKTKLFQKYASKKGKDRKSSYLK